MGQRVYLVRSLRVRVILLDGPMGTELARRGVDTPAPGWSTYALESHPHVVAAIHRDYAAAGATVHTANTFRTKRRQFPGDWEKRARLAVRICRESVPAGHRVAGSLAPLEDCYRPDLSPPPETCRAEHRELAEVLADAGCDLDRRRVENPFVVQLDTVGRIARVRHICADLHRGQDLAGERVEAATTRWRAHGLNQ